VGIDITVLNKGFDQEKNILRSGENAKRLFPMVG